MDTLNAIISSINGFAWGGFMILFLVGTGVILTLGTRVVQFRRLGYAFKLLFSKQHAGDGDITPFQALMTSLAATIGTGNIAGVATAIAAGGPGAVFWMWVTAAFGGATKYSEALLAIKYRTTNERGEKSGGPMYYIKLGMRDRFGGNFAWLGWLFAFFGFFASFGIGNMVQANSVAESLQTTFGIDPKISGIFIAIAVALVILGGIKSIANVTDKIVPAMAVIYIIGALIVLFNKSAMIPAAFSMIFSNAFTAKAVGGGLIGTVIRFGVARGVFSNEAGLGSAPIAHAASKNNDPVKQGIIGSLGSFLDTLVVCTMTALVILVSGLIEIGTDKVMMITTTTGNLVKVTEIPSAGTEAYATFVSQFGKPLTGAALTTTAFSKSLVGFGSFIVSFGLVFFAFSTILGWYYYGSKCLEYIAGVKIIVLYKIAWISLCWIGAFIPLRFVWNISDTFNGLMAIPNLIALLTLSPLIFKMTSDYERREKRR
ncbi:MAG: sodium:alanine symporter family protein [Maledivibacter sp.]|jgi:AGCS family alanine or glycine:cation symporter|nr:sodium:alanine symporter family protein [Maledivibacter sp.]